MSEPKLISPLLDQFAMGGAISDHDGVRCYPAMREESDDKYILKVISIPGSARQLDALLLSGAYPDAQAARGYFESLVNDVETRPRYCAIWQNWRVSWHMKITRLCPMTTASALISIY